MRILIIEDDFKIANALKKGLEQESYAVDAVYDGAVGIGRATQPKYDLIILDRMLPGDIDGINICKAVRDKKLHTHILMLTAKDKVRDRIEGLNAGADDYLIKPFAFEELLARVRALLRRPNHNIGEVLKADNLSMDLSNFKVMRQNKEINLSATEFRLLEYLMRNPNRILSKDNIIEHVWDYDADILPNTVEVYIGYLRNKIDKSFPKLPKLIQTVIGFGYKLKTE